MNRGWLRIIPIEGHESGNAAPMAQPFRSAGPRPAPRSERLPGPLSGLRPRPPIRNQILHHRGHRGPRSRIQSLDQSGRIPDHALVAENRGQSSVLHDVEYGLRNAVDEDSRTDQPRPMAVIGVAPTVNRAQRLDRLAIVQMPAGIVTRSKWVRKRFVRTKSFLSPAISSPSDAPSAVRCAPTSSL